MFTGEKTVLSFELFPPKKGTGTLSDIQVQIPRYKELHPDFISVTYGALGSTSKNSLGVASMIKNDFGMESLAHLTCLSSTKDDIRETLKEFKDHNIQNILALRGDFPQGGDLEGIPNPLQFEYASDLISFIKEECGDEFCIGSACYPEVHPEATSLMQDIINLKNKVDVGADFLISQLFFDNEVFYRFRETAIRAGINVPIIPGIMPIINAKQILKTISMCKASLPPKFKRILDTYEKSPEALKEAGIMYAIDQIIDLITSGVEGVHIYVMNRPDVAEKIIHNIGHILNEKRTSI